MNKVKSIDFLMVVSSIISKWNNPIFNNYVNLGISGFITENIINNKYLELIKKFKPKYIIFYCGGNDIKKNISTTIITKNIIKFIEFVYKNFNLDVKIIFLSVLITPDKIRRNLACKIFLLNDIITKICLSFNKLTGFNKLLFVDINNILTKNDYIEDDEHLTPFAYEKIGKKILRIVKI